MKRISLREITPGSLYSGAEIAALIDRLSDGAKG